MTLYHETMPQSPSAGPFGGELRQHRLRRGLSQLQLALIAGTTPRHLSFLETGRSRPGRELVLRLGEALDLSLRERNLLLNSAGFAPAYTEHSLDAPVLNSIRGVLDRVLENHEPFPAWVVTSGWRFLQANRAAERLMPGLCTLTPEEVVDMWFGPGPFRESVVNWQDVVWAGVQGLRRDVLRSGDAGLRLLLRRVEGHLREVPEPTGEGLPEGPVVCPVFQLGSQVVRTVSTVMRFDTAVDVQVAELRVELMFPADDAAEAFFRGLARG